jgi:hypothetical protein
MFIFRRGTVEDNIKTDFKELLCGLLKDESKIKSQRPHSSSLKSVLILSSTVSLEQICLSSDVNYLTYQLEVPAVLKYRQHVDRHVDKANDIIIFLKTTPET